MTLLTDCPSLSSLTIPNKKSYINDSRKFVFIQQLKLFLFKQPTHNHHIFSSRLLSHYGNTNKKSIGTGANANVVLLNSKDVKYAVKIFKYKNQGFMKKLISEFCISSTLDHVNIVKTIDLVLDEKGRYCTVMEYCSGGDLYSYIKEGRLTSQDQVDGYFKQLLDGLSYLHRIGVAHRDIKPENLLVVKQGNCMILKITDFGEADVFREIWQSTSRLSDGLCGSTPYIAPEIFTHSKLGYHATKADIWSAGIVYFCMIFNGVPFYSAQNSDGNFSLYKRKYKTRNYSVFEPLNENTRHVLYNTLNPDPSARFTIQQLQSIPWLANQKPPKSL